MLRAAATPRGAAQWLRDRAGEGLAPIAGSVLDAARLGGIGIVNGWFASPSSP